MRTVFIVDDNNANLFAAQKALSKLYKVFTLPSAPAMFELLKDVKPDMILLDIRMPEMDGLTALKLLKKDEQHKDIPVIFLTAQTDTATEEQGKDLGAVGFIAKPFTETELVTSIKGVLGE